jgi:alkylated DNA nucleotide flippase Atl1
VVAPGRVPRVARLLALAIRFDALIRQGAVRDYAELARLGGVSRARISQVMDLLNLSSDIQEAILYLPRVEGGRDRVTERELRPLVAEEDWGRQRDLWANVMRGGARRNASHSVTGPTEESA